MKEKISRIASRIWLYALLFLVMTAVIAAKKDYHMDEVFSYGLANNVGQTSIHPVFAPYTYENPAQIYLDYMVIQEGEGFSIENCWYNQERESSPPFYYLAVHMMSVFAGQRFSRWTAGAVNLIFMTLTFYLFRRILELFGVTGKKKTLFSLFFIVSPAILSIVSFFRMYTMAIFFATWMTYLILKYRRKENFRFYVWMILAAVGGVLTQYYLIFYLFFLSLVYGVSLLCHKEWKNAIKYIGSMGIAGGLTYLIFPEIIPHLFSASRGAEGIENFGKSFAVHWENIKAYFSIVNDQLFGGLFVLVLLAGAALLIAGKFCGEKMKIDPEKIWDWVIAFLPVICYIVMVATVAPYNTDRYIMASFAMILLFFLLGMDRLTGFCFRNKKAVGNGILAAVCAVVLFGIWKDFHWPYLYLNSEERLEQMQEYADVDGLCVLDVGWKISGNFNDIIMLDTMTFFENDISGLKLMEELKNKEEYLLYVVGNDPEQVIQQIYQICPQINQADYLWKVDYAEIYHLYHTK